MRSLPVRPIISPEYFEAVSQELLDRAKGLLTYQHDTNNVRVSLASEWTDNVNYDGVERDMPKDVRELYSLLDGKERDNLYEAFVYDRYIEDVLKGVKELKRKIYEREIGKKSRKEIKEDIRKAVKEYLDDRLKPIFERYKDEMSKTDVSKKAEEYFSIKDLKDYYEKLTHIKLIGIDSTLEDPSKSVGDNIYDLLKEEAASDFLTKRGLYFRKGDRIIRTSEYPTIIKKLSKEERKKVKEYEKQLGLKKSKAKAIAAAALIIGTGAAGAVAYNAYESGEKLKNDGFYFFHHPGDYEKYLKSIWEKHPNDIDKDRIPNDIEEKYGLNMFDPKDAKQDWDGDELTNYEELVKYAALFGPLNIHSKDSDGDYYNDSYEVKVPGLDPNNPDVDHDGLLDGKDNDGDGFTNWFERNKMMTDPLVYNDKYAVIVSPLSAKYFRYLTPRDQKKFLIDNLDFKPDHVIVLDGKNATFANYEKAINELKQRITPNDILLVDFDAHGSMKGIGILKEEDHFLRCTKYSEIADSLKDLKVNRLITFIGACYSGSAIKYFKNTTFTSPMALYTSMDASHPSVAGIFERMIREFWWSSNDYNLNGFVSIHETYLSNCLDHIEGFKYLNPQEYDPNKIANITYLKEIPIVNNPNWKEYASYFYKKLVEHGYR